MSDRHCSSLAWGILALAGLVFGAGCDELSERAEEWTAGRGRAPERPETPAPADAPPSAVPAPPVAEAAPTQIKPRGQRVRAGDGAAQVLVPAGSFRMGRTSGPEHEAPERVVTLTRDFWIDRDEVTVEQWQACVDAGGCDAQTAGDVSERYACNWRAGRARHPMNCVGTPAAEAYCAWAGGVLPSEAQWEFAARGEDGRAWPAKAAPTCAVVVWSGAGCVHDTTEPVGTRVGDVSVFGVRDLTGNVREWTADWYLPDAYLRLDAKDPLQSVRTRHRVSRGGAFVDRNTNNLRASFRHRSFADVRQTHNGFRCLGGTPR